jgi:hypothetical protein
MWSCGLFEGNAAAVQSTLSLSLSLSLAHAHSAHVPSRSWSGGSCRRCTAMRRPRRAHAPSNCENSVCQRMGSAMMHSPPADSRRAMHAGSTSACASSYLCSPAESERVDLVGSPGGRKRPCLQTTPECDRRCAMVVAGDQWRRPHAHDIAAEDETVHLLRQQPL